MRIQTAEEILAEKGAYMFAVSPETTIHEAVQVMGEKRIGAILVKDGEEYVGIWTERDLLHNITREGFDPKTAKIKDYMTKKLISAPHDATILQLKDMFLGRRLRHLLIERDGKYIGLLSIGDVTRASLEAQAEELEELSNIVHLDYYDAWRWKSKKRKKQLGI